MAAEGGERGAARRACVRDVEVDLQPYDELAAVAGLPAYCELALDDGLLEAASRSVDGAPDPAELLRFHIPGSPRLRSDAPDALRAQPLSLSQEPALAELERIQREEAERRAAVAAQADADAAAATGSPPPRDPLAQGSEAAGVPSGSRRTRGRNDNSAAPNAGINSQNEDEEAKVASRNQLLLHMRQNSKYSKFETFVRTIAQAAAQHASRCVDVSHEELEALSAGFERRAIRFLEKASARERAATGSEREDRRKVTRAWLNLVRRDIPRAQRDICNAWQARRSEASDVAHKCMEDVEAKAQRTAQYLNETSSRVQRLAKEVVSLARRGNSELEDTKRSDEQRASERRKRDEDEREKKRQEQRLNFLLTQTELYSHFMASKVSESEMTRLKENGQQPSSLATATADEDPEQAKIRKQATEKAANAAMDAQRATQQFDEMSRQIRNAGEPANAAGATNDSMLAPSSMPKSSDVKQPQMMKATLKEYQLTGMQWLVNLYEQGINGILADEMGLGKTIQAIALLGYLAEEKSTWGPFIVIAPSSTLSNWIDELERFAPQLTAQPYWGSLEDRQVLRKNLQNSKLHSKDNAAFHVLVTSYEILAKDEKYFRRITWHFMVLDEAQAIKSSQSQRWKMLLSFQCRNRLLLTGTPVQNNMQELWALLHFIMPTLFDSQEHFSNWFSKGVEGSVIDGQALNEHQLQRLHQVLKPFMLRRVKADVESQMANKEEKVVECKLSSHQDALYEAIRDEISLAGLLSGKMTGSNNSGTLMNAVMQLRKVCNHPELFERNEQLSSFVFKSTLPELQPGRGGVDMVPFNHHAELQFSLPKLLWRDGLVAWPSSNSLAANALKESIVRNRFSVFSRNNLRREMLPNLSESSKFGSSGALGFFRLFGLQPAEVSDLAAAEPLDTLAIWKELRTAAGRRRNLLSIRTASDEQECPAMDDRLMLHMPSAGERCDILWEPDWCNAALEEGPLIQSYETRLFRNIALLRRLQACIFRARAQPVELVVSDQIFARWQRSAHAIAHEDWLLFSGCSFPPPDQSTSRPSTRRVLQCWKPPLMRAQLYVTGYAPPLQKYSLAQSLGESGKMQELDRLLLQLRARGSRALLFCQMVRMMDILEDYLSFRRLRYLRLDGSTSLAERRNMVHQFQNSDAIFVFLLSTRAGGQGINLTAADSVIFYESDWNPTLDMQAMDRAHRLGQDKNVTVYRFMCKNTIEEQIIKRASQKNTVQQLVMSSKQEVGSQPEEMASLLKQDISNRPSHLRPAVGQRLGSLNLRGKRTSVLEAQAEDDVDTTAGGARGDDASVSGLKQDATTEASEQQQRKRRRSGKDSQFEGLQGGEKNALARARSKRPRASASLEEKGNVDADEAGDANGHSRSQYNAVSKRKRNHQQSDAEEPNKLYRANESKRGRPKKQPESTPAQSNG